jgi:squalene-hopene/tetraprenyl-beta-curcumene cyclase
MTAIVCFGLARAGVGQAIVDRCRRFLLDTCRPDGSWPVNRDLELSASMALVHGLAATGHGDDPRLGSTRDWILSCQRTEPFFVSGAPGGGWGWSMPSGWPNVDDTSSAIVALTALGVARDHPAVDGAVTFLRRMQGRDGGWGCFVRSGRFSLDAPCPVFTAHALEALAAVGLDESDRSVARGLRFLRVAQREDGAVYALWYRNWTAGTAAAIGAFSSFGRESTVEAQRCLRWLIDHQHDDGSWSGDGQEAGTVEETSWALAALVQADVAVDDVAVERAAGWLIAQQRPHGDWPPSLVGVYFPSLMYHDDAIATGSALRALGLRHGVMT